MRKSGHDQPDQQPIDLLRKLGYESTDVSLGLLMKWLGFLFAFIGGTSVVTFGIYVFFLGTPPEPAPIVKLGTLPEGTPAIQTNPHVDMVTFRRLEEAKVTGYGWVDKSRGIARIPVSEAMDKVLTAGSLPKAEPGAGKVAPARGEDRLEPGTAAPDGTTVGTQMEVVPAGSAPHPAPTGVSGH